MKKSHSKYVCQSCGYESPRWLGKCPECGSWNSFVEEQIEPRKGRNVSSIRITNRPIPITKIPKIEEKRFKTGIGEFDRVLGGGIVSGSVILVGGAPGIGKSTLLLHILGLLRPSHGSVKVFGKEASRMSVAELARSIGLIFQNPDLMLFQNTVWNEIAFGPQNVGLPKTEIQERVKEAIEMMRLIGFEKRHPRALSRGQRHRVAVASILSMRPKILIALSLIHI